MLPLVVRVKRESGQTQMFAFAESPIRIGRSPLNHLQLDEHYISRIEGVIRFDAREVTYFNVGRTNITLLNGSPVQADAEVALDDRSELVIGKLQLRFSREAVEENRLIRRTNRPTSDSEPAPDLGKTAFLDNPWSAGPPVSAVEAKPPSHRPPAVVQQSVPMPAPVPVSRPMPVSMPMPVSVSTPMPMANEPTRHPAPRPAPQPSMPMPTPVSTPRSGPPPSSSGSGEASGAGMHASETIRFSHGEYRRAWRSLLNDIEGLLASAPDAERANVAERIQREYPQVIRENEFRELLGRFGLKPRKPGDPELEQWLRSLGKGLFPPGVRLDTGMTIDRLGALLQMFSQVFVEIQAAQNDARKEMAVASGEASSLLASEDPKVILAYLLNPNVDGEKRMAELEQCVTKLAVHEAALFGAIKDAAQSLLEALSPEAVAREEQRSNAGSGGLSRVFASKQDAVDAKLWRRYSQMHENLMDGKQYQRKFIGREFARIYLRALEKLAPD